MPSDRSCSCASLPCPCSLRCAEVRGSGASVAFSGDVGRAPLLVRGVYNKLVKTLGPS